MLATQTIDLLRELDSGHLQLSDAAFLEQLSARELIADLEAVYPVKFQERVIGPKREVGMARGLRHEIDVRACRASLFAAMYVVPVLQQCLFISCYGDVVSEITTTSRLRVKPTWKPVKGLLLKTGRGFKLDRTPDGWVIKQLKKRGVSLSEEVLRSRGWQLDALSPFRPKLPTGGISSP